MAFKPQGVAGGSAVVVVLADVDAGDRVRLDFLVGVVTAIRPIKP